MNIRKDLKTKLECKRNIRKSKSDRLYVVFRLYYLDYMQFNGLIDYIYTSPLINYVIFWQMD